MVDVTSRDLAEELRELKGEHSKKLVQFTVNARLLKRIDAYAERYDVSRAKASRELVFLGSKILGIVDEKEAVESYSSSKQ